MKLQSIIFIFIFLIKINLNEGYGSILRKWDFLLPQEMMERIFALESDPTIDKMEVEKATDELLRSLPKNILDQLQLPQFYAGLPFNVRFPIKQLLFDPSLNWQQKHERIFQIIQNVPPILRKFGPSFPSTVSNGPSQKQHSRLFDSTRALKYSISFTFNLDELRNTIPIDKYMQIYNILEDNSLNIEKKKWALERLILELPSFSIITQQKMWAIERAMLELPSQILDKLFFIDSQIEPQMREKLRQYLFGHSTFTLMEGNAMDGNGQQQNVMTQQTMEQPILIWPNSLPSSSYGRVSILTQPIQIHQQKYGTGANFVSSSATFPAGKTTAISIDEHYNVLAPSSPSQIVEGEGVPKEGGEGNSEGQNMDSGIWNNYEGGLCAECNGIPNQMFSVRNIPQKVNPERKEGKGVRIRIPTFEENSEMDDAKTWPIEENAKKENIKIEKGTAKKSAANFMDPMIELNSAESDKNGNKNKVGVRRKHHLIRRNHLRVHNMNRLLMNILDNKDGKLGAI